MKRFLEPLLFSLLLVGGLLQAGTLRLDEALRQAQSHPDIQSALLKVAQSTEATRQTRSAWFPQISIFAEYDPQRTYTTPVNGSLKVLDETGWSAGATLSQQLFDFFRTRYLVEASRIRERIAALSAEEARALIRYQVRNAYAQILVQEAAIAARLKDLEAKKAMASQARALFKQGLKTQADALRFDASVAQARSDLAMARSSRHQAIISLEQLLGHPIAQGTRFQGSFLYKGTFPRGRQAQRRMLERNLGLRVAHDTLRSSRALYEAQRRERLGSVRLVGDLSRIDGLSRYDSKTVGIRYSAPIFQGGRLGAQSEQARLQELIDTQQIDSRRRSLLAEYRSLAAEWKALGRTVDAQKARIRSAKAARQLIKARYKEGLATYIDLLDAQATLLSARLGLLNAHFQRRNILNRLEYLYGK